MKKAVLLMLLTVLVLSGCGRGKINENSAAAHLGQPTSVQIIAEGFSNTTIRGRGDIQAIMASLGQIEVRKLTPEEEIDLIFVQSKTLNATEMRFRDSRGNVFKALLLNDGSVLVVEGARGSEDRRYVYLSAPGQQELFSEVRKHLLQQTG